MKRSKNTKPKAKPNGWEQDIKECLYAIGAKPIHFEMNNAGVRIINKIHQAILSAEEATTDKAFDWIWKCWCLDFGNLDRAKKQFKSLHLPDQEQLSNTKTE